MDLDKPIEALLDELEPVERGKRKAGLISEDDPIVDDLIVNYCGACGAVVFITETYLSKLPSRSTGDTAILPSVLKKLRCKPGPIVRVRRPGGIEMQYRWACPECQAVVAYQASPHEAAAKFVYAIKGRVTDDLTRVKTFTKQLKVPACIRAAPEGTKVTVLADTNAPRTAVRSISEAGLRIAVCRCIVLPQLHRFV
jgi:hypothetical protein